MEKDTRPIVCNLETNRRGHRVSWEEFDRMYLEVFTAVEYESVVVAKDGKSEKVTTFFETATNDRYRVTRWYSR